VKFEEIDATYPARIAPKLTAGHFHHNREKMRVDRAAQVLSAHFAAGIYVHCDGGRLPVEARDTADAVLMFDRLFDSFNGTKKAASMTQPVLKEYRVAMVETSMHAQLWDEVTDYLDCLVIVDSATSEVQQTSPFQKSLKETMLAMRIL